MSLLAHGGTGLINTWGFAYVGGIIGLFSVSLLYVKGKVSEHSSSAGQSPRRSALAALGPGVIVVGAVCGVSFGLGAAGVLERQFVDDIEPADVVARLCRSDSDAGAETEVLHDDIEHVIDDLEAVAASGVHAELHDERLRAPDRARLIDRLVTELTDADRSRIASCDEFARVGNDDDS